MLSNGIHDLLKFCATDLGCFGEIVGEVCIVVALKNQVFNFEARRLKISAYHVAFFSGPAFNDSEYSMVVSEVGPLDTITGSIISYLHRMVDVLGDRRSSLKSNIMMGCATYQNRVCCVVVRNMILLVLALSCNE